MKAIPLSETNKGDSAKNDDCTQEVNPSKISEASVSDNDWSLLGRYSAMWSEELGRIAAIEYRIALKPGRRPAHQIPYRQGPEMRAVTQSHTEE